MAASPSVQPKPKYRMLFITQADLNGLRDYSHSNPTPNGQSQGPLNDNHRIWKRDLNALYRHRQPLWVVCMYRVELHQQGKPEWYDLYIDLYCPVICDESSPARIIISNHRCVPRD